MKQTKICVITALLAVMLFLICGASAAETPQAAHITISDVTVNEGGTATATVIIDQVPSYGLSGYGIDLVVSDATKAQVSAVSFNSALGGLTDKQTVPFTTGYITWADTGEVLQTTATNIVLANLTITGLSAGSTVMTASLYDLTGDTGELMVPVSTIDSPAINVYVVPVAAFAADAVSPIVGDTVTFTDQSTGNPVSYSWTFGDGSTSTDKSPAHTYTAAGSYDVSLKVTNPAGTDTETKAGYITVTTQPVPVAAFTATPVYGTAPLSVTFTDASTNVPTSWEWQYRASGTSDSWTTFATTENPIKSFAAGAYDIKLTATNGGGDGTVTKTQYISSSAGAKRLETVKSGIVSGDLYVGAYQTVAFGTQTSKGTNTFEQTFTLPTYTNIQWARLYTVVYGSSADGRSGTATITFNGENIGTESLNTTSDSTNKVYPVSDNVDKQYTDYLIWYDVTDKISSTSPVAKVVATPVDSNFDARIKEVVLVVAYDDGDSDVVKYWVNDGHDYQSSVSPGPVTSTFATNSLDSGITSATLQNVGLASADAAYNFTGTPISRTTGTSLPYFETSVWDVTSLLNGNIGSNSNFVYDRTGSSFKTTLATLTARYVTPPTAAFTMSTGTAAVGQAVTFTDTSTIPSTNVAATYAWDFDSDGTVDSTVQYPTYSFASAATYSVKLTVTNEGGSSTATKTLVVTDKPIISVVPVGDSSMDPGETLTYNIVMDNAPNGLAGYDLKVTLGTASVADITAFSYDTTWASLTYSPTVPADSIKLGAVDSNQKVKPGDNSIVLATITIRGTVAGSSAITVSAVNMDDDYGNTIDTILTDGTVTVGSYAGPTAAFSGTPTIGGSPLTVTFDSSSSTGSITTYQWDFNNDGTIDSTAANPSYTYTSVGTYTVKLTVTGPGGSNSAVIENYITVTDDAPVAAFTPSATSGTYPLTVTFTDKSTGAITSYLWQYSPDDGTTWYTFATIQNPTKTFTLADTYLVKLTVTGSGGSSSATQTIIVSTDAAPVAAFIANPSSGLAPLTVAFSDQSTGSISSWAWAYSTDGGTTYSSFATTQNPTYEFAAGTYTVKLTVTGVGGSSSATGTIVAGSGLTAAFDGAPTTGVASRNHTMSVAFDSSDSVGTPTSYAWSFGDSGTSTLANPTHAYSGRPQSFTVTLTIGDGTDTDSVTKTAYITITPYLEQFPSAYDNEGVPTTYYTNIPTDLDSDYVYEDVNGNGRLDYDDVVKFYLGMDWIETNIDVDIENFDYNFNRQIDYDDINVLYDQIVYS